MVADLDLAVRVHADLSNAVRQLNRLERELKQAGAAGRTAGKGAREAAAGTDRASNSANRAARNYDRLEKRMDRTAGAAGRLRGAFAGIGAALVVREIVQAAAAITQTGLAFERLEQRFTFASGGIREGIEEFRFVEQEAERLGIAFNAAGEGFTSLAAAARGTALQGEALREIFLGVTEAGTVLQLRADQIGGALNAIEQIISKGVVSMEELRQQLGERIPGAFQIAARAMGVTTQELDKMVSSGELLAEDFLPRFAAELRRTFSDQLPDATQTAAAEFARLGNSIERLKDSIARSGLLSFLAEVSSALAEIIDLASGRGVGVGSARDLLAERDRLEADLARPRPTGAARAGNARVASELESDLARVQAALNALSAEDLAPELAAAASEVAAAGERVVEAERALAENTGSLLSRANNNAQQRRDELTAAGQEYEAAVERFRELRELEDEALLRRREAAAGTGTATEIEITPRIDREELDKALEKFGKEVADTFDDLKRTGARPQELLLFDFREDLAELQRVRDAAIEAARGNAEEIARINEQYGKAELALRARLNKEQLAQAAETREKLEEEEERRLARATAAAEREAEARQRVLREIEDRQAELGLITPYEHAVIAAERWRDDTIAALEAVGLATEEHLGRVNESFEEIISDIEKGELAVEGFAAGARRYAEEAADSLGSVADAGYDAFRGLEDELTRFVTTGKFSFKDFANSVIADLTRIAIRQQVVGPLAEAFGLGAGGSFFGLFHAGGVAGRPGGRERQVAPHVFAGARRLHQGGVAGGLRPDEIPTILRRGEGVFTPEQMAALGGGRAAPGPVSVEIVNQGTGQEAVSADARFDGQGLIVQIVVDDIRSGGRIGRTLQALIPGTAL